MKKQFIASVVGISSLVLLTACGGGGGGGGGDKQPPQETTPPVTGNVAASSAGATVVAAYNADSAGNLIDGDTSTTWISDPDSPIRINFAARSNISSFTLTRVNASATVGTNPDILIELSSDGTNFQRSNASVVSGGIPCSSSTMGQATIRCVMSPAQSVQAVRITTQNGKSFELAEFEAIAE